jgi:hypothetical protein
VKKADRRPEAILHGVVQAGYHYANVVNETEKIVLPVPT